MEKEEAMTGDESRTDTDVQRIRDFMLMMVDAGNIVIVIVMVMFDFE